MKSEVGKLKATIQHQQAELEQRKAELVQSKEQLQAQAAQLRELQSGSVSDQAVSVDATLAPPAAAAAAAAALTSKNGAPWSKDWMEQQAQWMDGWVGRGEVLAAVRDLCPQGNVRAQLMEVSTQDLPSLQTGQSNLHDRLASLESDGVEDPAELAAIKFFFEFTGAVLDRCLCCPSAAPRQPLSATVITPHYLLPHSACTPLAPCHRDFVPISSLIWAAAAGGGKSGGDRPRSLITCSTAPHGAFN